MTSDTAVLTLALVILIGLAGVSTALAFGLGAVAYATNPDLGDEVQIMPIAWTVPVLLLGLIIAVTGVIVAFIRKPKS